MSIEEVKKITVVAHKGIEHEVVEALVKAGTVHIEKAESEYAFPKELTDAESQELRKCSYNLSQIEFILGFLDEHREEKKGFLKSMIKPKYTMTLNDFYASRERLDLESIYADCSEREREYISLKEKIAQMKAQAEQLSFLLDVDIPINELTDGKSYFFRLVSVPVDSFVELEGKLTSEIAESSIEKVGEKGRIALCFLLYHREVSSAIEDLLKEFKIEDVTLDKSPLNPAERLKELRVEIESSEARITEIKESVKRYMEKIPDLEILREYFSHRKMRLETARDFGETKKAVVISGWVTEKNLERTKEALEAVSPDIALEFSDPAPEDDPPVSLDNPRWAKPFELLVKLFGPPNRHEFDPTIVVAISFPLFFGFCIGDVGYGIILGIAFLLLRKYLPLGKKAKDFLLAIIYGSFSAIFFGVITGSWFGIETKKLPSFLRSLAVLDPLNETLKVMGVCIAIGFIHMFVGTAAEFRDNWKQGNKIDALIDQGLVFLLFGGGAITAALFLAGVVPKSAIFAVGGLALVLMLCLLGRSAKSIPGKAINGLYETYGTVVGYISDAISYVRLFALGLATYMIGFVINTMSGLVMGIAPVIGVLLMLIVLVIGHTFNVAINLLGAFVHPMRLEFVEFFGKFYEDGGREFKPFGVDSKVVFIEEKEG